MAPAPGSGCPRRSSHWGKACLRRGLWQGRDQLFKLGVSFPFEKTSHPIYTLSASLMHPSCNSSSLFPGVLKRVTHSLWKFSDDMDNSGTVMKESYYLLQYLRCSLLNTWLFGRVSESGNVDSAVLARRGGKDRAEVEAEVD